MDRGTAESFETYDHLPSLGEANIGAPNQGEPASRAEAVANSPALSLVAGSADSQPGVIERLQGALADKYRKAAGAILNRIERVERPWREHEEEKRARAERIEKWRKEDAEIWNRIVDTDSAVWSERIRNSRRRKVAGMARDAASRIADNEPVEDCLTGLKALLTEHNITLDDLNLSPQAKETLSRIL